MNEGMDLEKVHKTPCYYHIQTFFLTKHLILNYTRALIHDSRNLRCNLSTEMSRNILTNLIHVPQSNTNYTCYMYFLNYKYDILFNMIIYHSSLNRE